MHWLPMEKHIEFKILMLLPQPASPVALYPNSESSVLEWQPYQAADLFAVQYSVLWLFTQPAMPQCNTVALSRSPHSGTGFHAIYDKSFFSFYVLTSQAVENRSIRSWFSLVSFGATSTGFLAEAIYKRTLTN